MNDHDSPISAQQDVTSNTARAPVAMSAPRHLDLPEILGLLAGDSQRPHEGERDIVASAIWRALQVCSAKELPSLSRFVQHFSHEIEARAQRARGKGLSLRGNLDLVTVLALCGQIHRAGLIDADGKQARSLLFLALVDLAIHCPELASTTSFKQADRKSKRLNSSHTATTEV